MATPVKDQIFTAVLTPLVDHPEAKDRVLRIDRHNDSEQIRA